jgi:very-short-patch-repair endonuclease
MEEEKPNMHRNASSQIFLNAKELRSQPTKAEKIVWENILKKRPLGYKFRFQHPFYIFILDFYCHKLKLAFEIDGEIHQEKFQNMYDKERDQLLEEEGIKVIRITNEKIFKSLNETESIIINIIKSRKTELNI